MWIVRCSTDNSPCAINIPYPILVVLTKLVAPVLICTACPSTCGITGYAKTRFSSVSNNLSQVVLVGLVHLVRISSFPEASCLDAAIVYLSYRANHEVKCK